MNLGDPGIGFVPQLVDADPKDGYWVQAADIDGDGRLDLVTSGLTTGQVSWYQNPGRDNGPWRKHRVIEMDKPVALDCGDIAGDGRADIVICHDYGKCMFDCGSADGKISWLRNPGDHTGDQPWEQRQIGDLVATHRLALGRFTAAGGTELLALPVVGPAGGSQGVDQPIEVTLFHPPANVLDDRPWNRTALNTTDFRIVHGVVVDRFAGTPYPDRDSLLLACEEGIEWFGQGGDGTWQHTQLHPGSPLQNPPEGMSRRFKGSGNLAVGRLGDNQYGYIAAIEPFHGNTLAVYTRKPNGAGPGGAWQRTVLAIFGDPEKPGLAVGHHVVAADFDGDGNDEFLVALRGPAPWQGVLYYKIDVRDGVIAQCTSATVSTYSTARIAVGDFSGDGRLDFATTGYYTEGYYKAKNPRIMVFRNEFGKPLFAPQPRAVNG
ncbi:FG-GAP repeat domain-containing protein [Saccharothrix deserti]|uniref:FG-GAP repeat domain-containing protein n=1 Tax=Saccharothrix deserti TaxID=2593674 RepID=UPI00131D1917|nr:VCBS repeat-containing protein [Saccharothrix deserti]